MAWVVYSLSETRIQMGVEELLRPIALGSGWNKIRIAARMTSQWQQPSTHANKFRMGLCCGLSGFKDPNTTGWLGLSTDITANFTYAASYFTTSVHYAIGKVGLTSVSTSVGTGGTVAVSLTPTHSAIIFDITRTGTYLSPGATGYVFSSRARTAAAGNTDLTLPAFIEAVRDVAGTPTGFDVRTPPTMTTYTGPTTFDTLSLSWDRSLPVLEISDLIVLRIA